MNLSKMSILCAFALSAAAAQTANAQTVLSYGEPAPNRGARAEATMFFAEEVERLTEGAVRIHINWAGSIFSERAAVQSIRDGVTDMGTIIAAYFPREMNGYAVGDLPLDIPDPWVGARATDEIMRTSEPLRADLARQNLVFIGTFTSSGVQLGCRGAPMTRLEDVAGRRVRGISNYGKVFRDLGATMVSIPIYEAYQGLETGLIDCTQTYSYVVRTLKFDEVVDNYTILDWGQIGALGIFMNKDIFDRLPAEHQAALEEAGARTADKIAEILQTDNEESLQILRDAGKQVITLPEEERARLLAAGEPYIAEWVTDMNAAGMDGNAILEEYKALLAKYRAELNANGYPWAD